MPLDKPPLVEDARCRSAPNEFPWDKDFAEEKTLIQSPLIFDPQDKHSEDVELLNPNLPQDEVSKMNSNWWLLIIIYLAIRILHLI